MYPRTVQPKLSQGSMVQNGLRRNDSAQKHPEARCFRLVTAFLPGRRMNPKRGKRNFGLSLFLKSQTSTLTVRFVAPFQRMTSILWSLWLTLSWTWGNIVFLCQRYPSLWMKREGDWGVGGITRRWEGARQMQTIGRLQTGAGVGVGIPEW